MRRPLLIGTLIGGMILAVVAAGVAASAYMRFHAPGPLAEQKIVVIPKGSGLRAIGGLLEREGVVADALLFRLGVRVYDRAPRLLAGEYAFAPGISMHEAMGKLARGETLVRRVTVPEGLTSRQVVDLLLRAEGMVGGIEEVPAEGSLLPDTYHYSYGDSRADLLRRMSDALQETLAELWLGRAESLPLASPEEALVLASMVEKETGVADERPLVAGVFINRLRKGMRLQSDPTVVYGLTNGEQPLDRQLTRKDLAAPSPYNTYMVAGLPPGPIANVGRATLEAVLAPAETEFLYFVADGNGGHAFARSLDEHNRNVAAWRKLRKRIGTAAE